MKCVRCNRKEDGMYICRRCQRIAELNRKFMKATHTGQFDEARRISEEIIALLDTDEVIKL